MSENTTSSVSDLRLMTFCFASVLHKEGKMSLVQFYALMHVYYRKASTNVINDTNMASTFRELLDKGYLAKLNDRIYKVSGKGHEVIDEMMSRVNYIINYGDTGMDFLDLIRLERKTS